MEKRKSFLDDVDASFSSVDPFGLSINFCLYGGILTSEKRCGDETLYWETGKSLILSPMAPKNQMS